MKIELRYFSGTGNSFKILDTCREVFAQSNHEATISEINLENTNPDNSDLLGFCFPVYAFGIPRICRKYLNSIQKFNNRQKVFVLVTAGDSDESGFSLNECEQILKKKNCDIVYSGVIQMPINWTTSPVPPFPPAKEEAGAIIEAGIEQAKSIAQDILNGNIKLHEFNFPRRYGRVRFYKDYWLFKYMGIQNLWRTFRVYDTCNGCGLCSKICPTKSIMIEEKRPVWSSTCEQCMRCVNFCPNESIYQSMGGETKGKNKYHEPDFKPHHMKKLFVIALFSLMLTELSSQSIIFDNFISLQKPENLTAHDSVSQDLKLLEFESDTVPYSFTVVRMDLNSKDSEINYLPYDSTSLEQTYQYFIEGYNKTAREHGFEVTDSFKVDFNGFIAYKVIANTITVDTVVYASLILLLDKYAYTFSYWGPDSEGDNGLNKFLDSVTINSESKLSQTVGRSPDYKRGYLIGQVLAIPLLLVLLFFVIRFIGKRRK